MMNPLPDIEAVLGTPQAQSFDPRPHQHEALRNLSRLREQGEQRALVVMASGLGKTVVAAHDALQFEREVGRRSRAVYLSHQSVILDQARSTFRAILGSDRTYGRFDGEKRDPKADILFATFQSMHRHLEMFERAAFDYAIVDEAHHTAAPTRDEVVAYFRTRFRLGLTATPFRGDGKDILEYYGDVVAISLALERALAQSLLAPIDYRLCTDPVDAEGLERALRSAGRTTGGGVFRHQNDQAIVDLVMRNAPEMSDGRRILVFCASLPQMYHFAQLFPNARTISGDDSRSDQIATVREFAAGRFEVLLSRDVLNEGIDVPEASTLVFLRNTESPVVFLQQLGRGLRLSPGKQCVTVLDFVDNVDRIEFVYSFMSRVSAEEELSARDYLKREAPRSSLTLDQTAQDIIGSLLRKKIDAGYLVGLDGVAAVFGGKVSPATLRRVAVLGDLTPELGSAAFTGQRTLYFDRMTVHRFMRQVHAPRIPDGLVRDTDIARGSGMPVAWIRRQQERGRLPAAWFHIRGAGSVDFYYTPEDAARAAALSPGGK
jgi:superfamily II DNA or RNA helicase